MEVTYYEDDAVHRTVEVPTGSRIAMVAGLKPGEPIFVLRGQDALALATINLWREMAYGLLDDDRAEAVEVDLHAFIDWRRGAGREYVKDPD